MLIRPQRHLRMRDESNTELDGRAEGMCAVERSARETVAASDGEVVAETCCDLDWVPGLQLAG